MQLGYLSTALVLSALVPSILAQDLSSIPDCANSCIANGIPASCNLDPACICTADTFIQAIASCACAACVASDYEATVEYAHAICDPVGADLNLESSCPSSDSSSSSLSSSSSSSSTTTTPSSSSTSSPTSSPVSSSVSSPTPIPNPASTSTSTSTSSPSSATEQPDTSSDVSSTTSTAPSDSTAEASSENPDGGMDMGTKVGIGVGAGLGGLFLLLLTFWLGRRHAKGNREKSVVTGAGAERNQRPLGPELEGKYARTEIMDNEKKEWPAAGYEHTLVSERAELEAISKQWAELDASRTQKHQLQ